MKKVLNNLNKFFRNTFKAVINTPRVIRGFFVGIYEEIRLTEYLSRSQTLRLTNLVLVVTIVTGLLLYAIDSTFVMIRTYLSTFNT